MWHRNPPGRFDSGKSHLLGTSQTLTSCQIVGIKFLLWFLSFILNFEHATWDDKVVNGLDFIQNYVLQVPLLLMTLMRYVTPTLDNM